MKLILLLLIACIFVSGCVHIEKQKEIPSYDPTQDLALLEQSKAQRESLEKPKEETLQENKCEEVLKEIKKDVEESKRCNTHEDCGLVNIEFGCIGSYLPVNKKAVVSIVPLMKFLDEKCDVEKCNYRDEYVSVACIDFTCKKVARTG